MEPRDCTELIDRFVDALYTGVFKTVTRPYGFTIDLSEKTPKSLRSLMRGILAGRVDLRERLYITRNRPLLWDKVLENETESVLLFHPPRPQVVGDLPMIDLRADVILIRMPSHCRHAIIELGGWPDLKVIL